MFSHVHTGASERRLNLSWSGLAGSITGRALEKCGWVKSFFGSMTEMTDQYVVFRVTEVRRLRLDCTDD